MVKTLTARAARATYGRQPSSWIWCCRSSARGSGTGVGKLRTGPGTVRRVMRELVPVVVPDAGSEPGPTTPMAELEDPSASSMNCAAGLLGLPAQGHGLRSAAVEAARLELASRCPVPSARPRQPRRVPGASSSTCRPVTGSRRPPPRSGPLGSWALGPRPNLLGSAIRTNFRASWRADCIAIMQMAWYRASSFANDHLAEALGRL